jgi:acyl-CoA-binding protein
VAGNEIQCRGGIKVLPTYFLNIEARAKYNEWAAADNVAKQEVCNAHIKLVEELVAKPVTGLTELTTVESL